MTRLHTPTVRRRWATALVVAALACLTACGGTKAADPPPAPRSSTTVTPSPTPTKPAWAAKYTDAQYADYLAALARYKDYLAHDQPWLNSNPKAAIPMVRKYFTADEGAYQLKLIAYNHKYEFRADRNPILLWGRMTRYAQTAEGQPQVAIDVCMDARAVHSYQHGNLLTGGFKTPVVYLVTMGRTPAGHWLIATIANPGIDKMPVRKCAAE